MPAFQSWGSWSIYIIEESFFSSLFLFSLIHFIMISTVQGGKCVRGVSLRGGKRFAIWTNTFCNLDKCILQFGQINFVIWTNTFCNLENTFCDKCVRGVSLRGGKQKLAFVTTFRTGDFSDTPRSEVLKAMNMTNNLFSSSSSSFSALNVSNWGNDSSFRHFAKSKKCRSLPYFSFV